MAKERYKLIIDGETINESNSITYLKKQANFYFEVLNSFYGEILKGSKVYAHKKYNRDWRRTGL